MKQINFLFVIVWGLILVINTWTNNFNALIQHQSISFRWDSSPDFLSFFNFYDISQIHHNFVIVKIGHFIGFGIFDLFLFNWKKNHYKALVISFVFAMITEVLQFFFGRDGRLYDLIIDFLGAISVYLILKWYLLYSSRRHRDS